jgi:hypothetical protein
MGFLRAVSGAAICLGLFACDRNFDGPFLPASPDYAGTAWTRDSDGDGVADSVAKYAPDCSGDAAECMRLAKDRAIELAKADTVPDTTAVPVKPARIAVDSIAAQDLVLLPGESKTPQIRLLPANATDRSFDMASGNGAVALVGSGDIVGAAAGTAKIEVRARDGSGKSATFQVTVAPKPTKLEAKALRITMGSDYVTPQIVFTPSDASLNGYALSGGDASIAGISADGRSIRPVSPGKTSIKAKAIGYSNIYATLSVTVVAASVPLISVKVEDMSLIFDDPATPVSAKPAATWTPSDATDKSYSLSSADILVAKVVGDAVESGFPGETIVRLTSRDGAKSADFKVKVAWSRSDCLIPILGCLPPENGKENGDDKGKAKGKG